MPGIAPGGGNVFTRKVGPLPAWGWMSIAAAGVLLIVVYEYRKGGSSSTASTSAADTTPPTVFEFPPESEPAGDGDGDSDDGGTTTPTPGKPKPKKPKDAHPKAFHIKPGQHPPTTRHGSRVWVHGHYGPKGAFHKGHWSGAGKKGGGVPQPKGK